MISETLANSLKDLPFPHKLYILASNSEIKSIRWTRDEITVKLYMKIMKRELGNPLLLNVRKFDDLIPVLFDYDFQRINSRRNSHEFRHPFFKKDRINLLAHVTKKRNSHFELNIETRLETKLKNISRSSTSLPGDTRRNSPFVPMENQITRVELKALPPKDLLELNESSSSLDSSDSNRGDPPIKIPTTREKVKAEDFTLGKNFDCIIESTSRAILTPIPTKKLYFKPDNMNALLEIDVENATIFHDAGRKRASKSASVFKVTNQYVIDGSNPHAVRKLDKSRATGVSAQQNQTQIRPPNVLISNNETYIPPAFGDRNNFQNTSESHESCRNFDVNSKNENNFENVFSPMETPTLYGNTGSNSVIHDLFGSLLDNNRRDAPPHDYYTDAEGLLYGNSTLQSSFAIEDTDQENFNIPTPSSSLAIQNDEGICSDSLISSNELNFKQADPDFTAFCDTPPSPIIDDKSVIKNIPTISGGKSYELAEEEQIPFNSSQSSANKNVSKGKVLLELHEESQSPSDTSQASDT